MFLHNITQEAHIIMDYRKATITIDVPVVKKEEGKIPMQFDVEGMIAILESQIANLMSTSHKLTYVSKGNTRHKEAMFILGELRKFYLAEAAGVSRLPEVEE